MTEQQLATAIAKREGKRSQTTIGNIREIIKVIQVMVADEIVLSKYNEVVIPEETPLSQLLYKKAVKAALKKNKAKD